MYHCDLEILHLCFDRQDRYENSFVNRWGSFLASLFTIRFAHFSVADKACFLVAFTCLERDLKSLERGLTMSSYLPKGKSHSFAYVLPVLCTTFGFRPK